jgi:hypothetical protein
LKAYFGETEICEVMFKKGQQFFLPTYTYTTAIDKHTKVINHINTLANVKLKHHRLRPTGKRDGIALSSIQVLFLFTTPTL